MPEERFEVVGVYITRDETSMVLDGLAVLQPDSEEGRQMLADLKTRFEFTLGQFIVVEHEPEVTYIQVGDRTALQPRYGDGT